MEKFFQNNKIKHFSSLLFFFIASIYLTFPLIFHLGNYATGVGDELVMAWIQNWDIHALVTNPFNIFNANLYYPFHHTLAYAESLIFTSILAFPIQMLVGEPIATVNFTFISSLTLLGFSLYLLAYYLTKNYFFSVLSGVLVIFSPAVLDYATHMQILAIEWVPLAILSFLHFIKTKKSRYFLLSLIFFIVQVYNSFMPGYFIVVSFIIIYLYQFIYLRKQAIKLITLNNIFFLIVTLLLIIPVIVPYYQVSKEFNYVRDIRDAVHFAMQPEDLLYPSNHTRIYSFLTSLPFNQTSQNGEFKPGFIGVIFSLLSFITIYYFFIHFKKKKNILISSFASIGLLGLILSLGPVLHLGRHTVHQPFLVPLPYALFYYLLPGFQGFRNSARWEMLFILAMAIAIPLVMDQICRKYSNKKIIYLSFILIFFCIFEFNFPMRFFSVTPRSNFPPVYQWLNTTEKDAVVIILPIYNWNMPHVDEEINREYFSTVNFRKTVNGYTSFSSPPWQQLVIKTMEQFPSAEEVKQLRSLGVDYLIIQTKKYDQLHKEGYIINNTLIKNGDEIIKTLNKDTSLQLVKRFGDDYVYAFVK